MTRSDPWRTRASAIIEKLYEDGALVPEINPAHNTPALRSLTADLIRFGKAYERTIATKGEAVEISWNAEVTITDPKLYKRMKQEQAELHMQFQLTMAEYFVADKSFGKKGQVTGTSWGLGQVIYQAMTAYEEASGKVATVVHPLIKHIYGLDQDHTLGAFASHAMLTHSTLPQSWEK